MIAGPKGAGARGGLTLGTPGGVYMSLRETLQKIITEYPLARAQPLEGHGLANFIRDEAERSVKEGLGEFGMGLIVEGSPGRGNWANVHMDLNI